MAKLRFLIQFLIFLLCGLTGFSNSWPEGIEVDFKDAMEKCIAHFPALAGQTYYTMDLNRDVVNWTQDAAELYLIQYVLSRPDLPQHTEVCKIWLHNRAQMADDLGGAGSTEDVALGDYLAGMISSNSRNRGPIERAFVFIGIFGGPKNLTLSPEKYIHQDALLAFNADPLLPGDFTGNGVTNDQAYWIARKELEKNNPGLSNDIHPGISFWKDDLDGNGIPDYIEATPETNRTQESADRPVGPDDADILFIDDIIYATVGDIDLKLDLVRPLNGEGPFPLIVCIHGGGWQLGDKSAYATALRAFARHGYVAAALGYRLAPGHQFPAQIEDVKTAVRFLRAHAEDYEIDPRHVGAIGDSAGGYLSVMLGLLDPADGMEGPNLYRDHSSKVQAVVNYYGGFDFRTWELSPTGAAIIASDFGKSYEEVLADFLGTADRSDPLMAKASPATYADAYDPPVLTFHGVLDQHVPIEQGRQFHEALIAAGVRSHLEVIDNAAHGWGGKKLEYTQEMTLAFFDRELKGLGIQAEALELSGSVYSERPSDIIIEEDIVYREIDGHKLHLDLARPKNQGGPSPLILAIHGGAYELNARKALHRDIQGFAENGYVAASIEYRGLLKGRFPYEPVQDAKTALCFLRANASRFGIDPERVGLWGGSMGAWVALMAGLTQPGDGFEPEMYQEKPTRVQAIAERYGPTDFKIMLETGLSPEMEAFIRTSFGTTELNSVLAGKSSPVSYVRADSPPVLILHNPKDTVFTIAHSERLLKALQQAGAPVWMEQMKGGWHASEFTEKTPEELRDRQRCRTIELDFFGRYLKNND